MTPSPAGLRLGFIEPHLLRFGGIRRMLEFTNRLAARGHHVTFYLPEDQVLDCTWMRCEATIKPMPYGFEDDLDVIVFNEETQWHLLDRFVNARKRIFYALHYARTYDKAGAWESIRTPVDLQLANSNWTADLVEGEIGHRPTVLLGGANREVFRPYGGPKKYPILCVGDTKRTWKGTDTILEAGRLLGRPVETYAPKDLSQPDLGREYDAAEVFVVGSWYEGFCQPGLEAMACGVPLVTTDNGGCREYAIHEQTALVVPPKDPVAMAGAIRRLLNDDVLAKELVANGLDLVERDFDWERRTDEFAEILEGVVSGTVSAPPPTRPDPPAEPELSIVVLAWDNLPYTRGFVESVRQHTDVPYELIIVDNGSQWEAANYAAAAADVAVMNQQNNGFAKGMNQGLEVAKGRYVAFCNNDTVLPPGWASKLIETARTHPNAGLVVPALTEARNARTVRTEPGQDIEVLPPFSAPPAAVIYVLPKQVVEDIGEWGEEYEVASGEDVDLAFKVWVNDLDIVYDQRVLIAHIGKGSASRLDDWQALWAKNRRRFLDKWMGDEDVPRLESCPPERFARNRATAAAAAGWMNQYFKARDKPATVRQVIKQSPFEVRLLRIRSRLERQAGRQLRRLKRRAPVVVRSGRKALVRLPEPVREPVRKAVKQLT
jgi:glycosyltransferase involved in cell wall biosynthesis/GT2 family glycosyltransferase